MIYVKMLTVTYCKFQARAPNSPVLIIGTHFDLVKENFPPTYSEDLQQLIRDRYVSLNLPNLIAVSISFGSGLST
jgi:hypothetical protein